MAAPVLRHRFSVMDLHRMQEFGILSESDRMELIEGEIHDRGAISGPHASTVKRLNKDFSNQVGERALVSVQDPVLLGGISEPLPDLALLRPRADFYARRHAGPRDILLLVEVSDSSLDYDREVKLPLYARAKIPEVWIVNLIEKVIEVYRRPSRQGYKQMLRCERGDRLSPLKLSGIVLAVDEILG